MRFILDLAKAEQLGLFGPRPTPSTPTSPTVAPHPAKTTVRLHVRRTAAGELALVQQHQRGYDPAEQPSAAPAAPPIPAPVPLAPPAPVRQEEPPALPVVVDVKPAEPQEVAPVDDPDAGHELAHPDDEPRVLLRRVDVSRWSGWQDKMEELARRARRLKLDPPVIEELGMVQDRVDVGTTANPHWVTRWFHEVRITRPEIRIKGWDLLAKRRVLDSGRMDTIARDDASAKLIPSSYRDSALQCDHCKVNARRTKTYLLRHEGQGYKEVGSECLKDFLGRSADSFETMLELDKEYEEDWGVERSRSDGHDPLRVLSLTAFLVEKDGFWSRTRAERDGVQSTADSVNELLTPTKPTHPLAPARARLLKEWASKQTLYDGMAKTVLDWAGALPPADVGSYEERLRVILTEQTIPSDALTFAVSAYAAFERAQGRSLFEKRVVVNEPLAPVGTKIGINDGELPPIALTIEKRIPMDTQFGFTNLIIGRTDDGHVVKFYTSKSELDILSTEIPIPRFRGQWGLSKPITTIPIGERGTIWLHGGTVKKISEFRDTKQTELSRVTVMPSLSRQQFMARFLYPTLDDVDVELASWEPVLAITPETTAEQIEVMKQEARNAGRYDTAREMDYPDDVRAKYRRAQATIPQFTARIEAEWAHYAQRMARTTTAGGRAAGRLTEGQRKRLATAESSGTIGKLDKVGEAIRARGLVGDDGSLTGLGWEAVAAWKPLPEIPRFEDDLEKAHVKTHVRVGSDGQMHVVHEHERSVAPGHEDVEDVLQPHNLPASTRAFVETHKRGAVTPDHADALHTLFRTKDLRSGDEWTALNSAQKHAVRKLVGLREKAEREQLESDPAEIRRRQEREAARQKALDDEETRQDGLRAALRALGAKRVFERVKKAFPDASWRGSTKTLPKSSYLDMLDSDGDTILRLRIADHASPSGGGFREKNGVMGRHGEADIMVDPSQPGTSLDELLQRAIADIKAEIEP